MTQEEKAKRYDELLVKLQEAKVDNNVCDERYCCVIDDIVPELKESEDERIRKAIIDLLNTTIKGRKVYSIDGTTRNEMIAWLEKQGQVNESLTNEDERIKKMLRDVISQWRTGNQAWCSDVKLIDATLAWLEKQGQVNESLTNEDERTWIINYLRNRKLNSSIIAEKENLKKAIAWLKKQGEERKITHEEICKSYGISDIGEFSDGYHTFNSLYKQRMILFAVLVKTYKDRAWKSWKHEDGLDCFGGGWFIVGIDTPAGTYTYHYEAKDWDRFDCQILEKAKHWDGHDEFDVERLFSLVSDANKDDERLRNTTIAFLKDFAEQGYENAVECIDWLEKQGEQKPLTIDIKSMVDSYEHRLIKNGEISNNPLVNMCVAAFKHGVENTLDELHLKQGEQILANSAKTCKDEQKPAWNEKYIADVFEKVGLAKIVREQSNDNLTNALQDAMIELSKFIPQPNPAWSEEDEKKIMWLVRLISTAGFRELDNDKMPCSRIELLNWLKSLRPQTTWKPSDEQMEVIKEAMNIAGGRYKSCLNSLYSDLKKLMEE